MILTVTPNPSLDTTLVLSGPLERGEVQRPRAVARVAGGKGVNVTQAVRLAGRDSLALFPARHTDPFLALADEAGIPFDYIDVPEGVRINTTVEEPGGVTTKLNGPGASLSPRARRALTDKILEYADQAQYLVMAGSLPQGTPADLYSEIIMVVSARCPGLPIAVDTSEAAIEALGEHLALAAPSLIAPNGDELGQLVGAPRGEFEQAALAGDYSPTVQAAHDIHRRGVREVLVTLGAAGAVLVNADGVWRARAPKIAVRSTVGAGDAFLAGYLMGWCDGADPKQRLARAVAYGTAATGLPGTTMPAPSQINPAAVDVEQVPRPPLPDRCPQQAFFSS